MSAGTEQVETGQSEIPQNYLDAIDNYSEDAATEEPESAATEKPETTETTIPAEKAEETKTPGDDQPAGDEEVVDDQADSKGGELSWQETLSLASEMEINTRGMGRVQVERAIVAKNRQDTTTAGDLERAKQFARDTYGVPDSQLADFKDVDSLNRAVSFLEDQLIRQQVRPTTETPVETAKDEKIAEEAVVSQFAEKFEAFKESVGEDDAAIPLMEALKADFDDLRKSMDDRHQQTEQAATQAEEQRITQSISQWIVGLGEKELFGESWEKATPEQQKAQQRVFDETVRVWQAANDDPQRPVDWSEELVGRAFKREFASELIERAGKTAAKDINGRMRKASGKRLGSGSRTPSKDTAAPTSEEATKAWLVGQYHEMEADPENQ